MHLPLREFLLVLGLLAAAHAAPAQTPAATTPETPLQAKARSVLFQVLDGPQSWEQMHAIEGLIACGEGARVHEVLGRKWAPSAQAPFRNSVWRFLAATSRTAGEKLLWIEKIKAVLRDPKASDQGQAVEVLDKLRERLKGPDLEIVRRLAAGPDGPNTYFCLWALRLAAEPGVRNRLILGLDSNQPASRKGAAGVLRWTRATDGGELAALARAADREPAGSMAYPGVLAAAVSLEPAHPHAGAWQAKLDQLFFTGQPRERLDAGYGLMLRYGAADLPRLAPLLDDPHADTRCIAAWTILQVSARAAGGLHVWVGTYTATTSRGIYALRFDPANGTVTSPTVAAEAKNPSFLAVDPSGRRIYAGEGMHGGMTAYRVAPGGRLVLINDDPAVPDGMISHLAIDGSGKVLAVAGNTKQRGFAYAFALRSDGSLGARSAEIEHRGPPGPILAAQSHPHAHSVAFSPDGRFALVCDRGIDRIFTYQVDPAGSLGPDNPPFFITAPGFGPRHSVFSPDAKFFYVVGEMSGAVSTFAYTAADGTISLRETVSAMAPDFHGDNESSEIALGRDARFLYVSNRGKDSDSLTVFARDAASGTLRQVQIISCGGKTPRHFALTPDGGWLLCANQDTDNIVTFRVDPADGRLTRQPGQIEVPRPSCIVFTD